MAGLDALLGIEDEPPKGAASKGKSTSAAPTSISVSQEALSKIADAEAQRLSRGDSQQQEPLK